MKLLKAPKPGSNHRNNKVLAICGDTQVGLWLVRSLARNGLEVFALCHKPTGLPAHSRYSSGAWMVEKGAKDPGFADEIYALAQELDVGSIMPISETYLDTFLSIRDHFEPGIHLFCPPRQCFDKAVDKNFMNELCIKLGIPVAKGTTLDKLIAANNDPLNFPLVLRTSKQHYSARTGNAPFKAAYAANKEQLNTIYHSVRDIAQNVLVQEYHPGAEDHIQILMHQREPFMAGEYIGEHHMPLAGGVTVQRVSCQHNDLAHDAIRLLKAIEWDGIAGVQFHYDPTTDKYIFLEINPRFIGGLPTVIMAGFEAPFLLWQSHFQPEKMKITNYKLGLRTRILGGDANWMLAMCRGDELPPGQSRLSKASAALRFLWNCVPWTKDDVFMLGDLKPMLVDIKNMIKNLGTKTFDIIGNPNSEKTTKEKT